MKYDDVRTSVDVRYLAGRDRRAIGGLNRWHAWKRMRRGMRQWLRGIR